MRSARRVTTRSAGTAPKKVPTSKSRAFSPAPTGRASVVTSMEPFMPAAPSLTAHIVWETLHAAPQQRSSNPTSLRNKQEPLQAINEDWWRFLSSMSNAQLLHDASASKAIFTATVAKRRRCVSLPPQRTQEKSNQYLLKTSSGHQIQDIVHSNALNDDTNSPSKLVSSVDHGGSGTPLRRSIAWELLDEIEDSAELAEALRLALIKGKEDAMPMLLDFTFAAIRSGKLDLEGAAVVAKHFHAILNFQCEKKTQESKSGGRGKQAHHTYNAYHLLGASGCREFALIATELKWEYGVDIVIKTMRYIPTLPVAIEILELFLQHNMINSVRNASQAVHSLFECCKFSSVSDTAATSCADIAISLLQIIVSLRQDGSDATNNELLSQPLLSCVMSFMLRDGRYDLMLSSFYSPVAKERRMKTKSNAYENSNFVEEANTQYAVTSALGLRMLADAMIKTERLDDALETLRAIDCPWKEYAPQDVMMTLSTLSKAVVTKIHRDSLEATSSVASSDKKAAPLPPHIFGSAKAPKQLSEFCLAAVHLKIDAHKLGELLLRSLCEIVEESAYSKLSTIETVVASIAENVEGMNPDALMQLVDVLAAHTDRLLPQNATGGIAAPPTPAARSEVDATTSAERSSGVPPPPPPPPPPPRVANAREVAIFLHTICSVSERLHSFKPELLHKYAEYVYTTSVNRPTAAVGAHLRSLAAALSHSFRSNKSSLPPKKMSRKNSGSLAKTGRSGTKNSSSLMNAAGAPSLLTPSAIMKPVTAPGYGVWQCGHCEKINGDRYALCECGASRLTIWECDKCTFINSELATECRMCAAEKPSSTSTKPNGQPRLQSKAYVSSWQCSACNSMNGQHRLVSCGKCESLTGPLAKLASPSQCKNCCAPNDLGPHIQPFCTQCGTLTEITNNRTKQTFAPADPHLWECPVCTSWIPWTEDSCSSCTNVRRTASRKVKDWVPVECPSCKTMNSNPLDRGCIECGAELDSVLPVRARQDAINEEHHKWVCPSLSCMALNPANATSCSECNTPQPSEDIQWYDSLSAPEMKKAIRVGTRCQNCNVVVKGPIFTPFCGACRNVGLALTVHDAVSISATCRWVLKIAADFAAEPVSSSNNSNESAAMKEREELQLIAATTFEYLVRRHRADPIPDEIWKEAAVPVVAAIVKWRQLFDLTTITGRRGFALCAALGSMVECNIPIPEGRCRHCLGTHPEDTCVFTTLMKTTWECQECGATNDTIDNLERYLCSECLQVRPLHVNHNDDEEEKKTDQVGVVAATGENDTQAAAPTGDTNNTLFPSEGWECPSCKRVNVNFEDMCVYCHWTSHRNSEDLVEALGANSISDVQLDAIDALGDETPLEMPFLPTRCGVCGQPHLEALCPNCSVLSELPEIVEQGRGVVCVAADHYAFIQPDGTIRQDQRVFVGNHVYATDTLVPGQIVGFSAKVGGKGLRAVSVEFCGEI